MGNLSQNDKRAKKSSVPLVIAWGHIAFLWVIIIATGIAFFIGYRPVLSDSTSVDWTGIGAIASIAAGLGALLYLPLTFLIFQKQNQVAETQAEIMVQQNKIALFEKRYGVYINLQTMGGVLSLIVDHKDSLDYAALMRIVDVANEANKFKSHAEFYMNMKAYMPKISMLFPEVDSSHTLILLGECEKLLLYAWKKQKLAPQNSINHSLQLSDEHKKIVENLENGQEAYLEFISEIESQLQLK